MYAQAGIRALIYQEYLEVAATSNFWIPACAGMTVIESSLFQSAVKNLFRRPFDIRVYKPSSPQISSILAVTAGSFLITRPHSRSVSPDHLLVASKPILPPSPLTGLAKSR